MTCFMHGCWVSQVGEFHINKVQRVAKGERHTGRGQQGGDERGRETRVGLRGRGFRVNSSTQIQIQQWFISF